MGRCVGLSNAFLRVMPGAFYPVEWNVPECFTGRGRWRSGPLHTFVDDYRQEFYWRKPNEGLMVALVASVCTAPDFTVWSDDPVEWKRFQAWRSAMVAGLWAAWGVRVLPVVSFESGAYEYVAAGSTWAVRSPGKGPDVVRQWVKSLSAFARDSDMGRLVLFGRELVGLDQELGVPVLVRGLRKRPDAVLLRAA